MRTEPIPVIVASKRAPVEYGYSAEGSLVSSISPGGTASVIADQAAYLGVTWLASAMSEADAELARQNPRGIQIDVSGGTAVRLRLLTHAPDVFDLVQYYFVNEVLWLSQHGLHNRWLEPTYTDRTLMAWNAFVEFNTDYARAVLESAEEAGTTTFLVHDFQLMYTPRLIRETCPDARILAFSHSAWPGPDEWRVVPRYVRAPLIEAALGADVIGFFSRRWVTNFLRCVTDLVPAAQIDWARSQVALRGHRTAVRAMPLGYSPRALSARRSELPAELAAWIADACLVVHSGRTDPIKNAPRAIDVFTAAVRERNDPGRYRLVVKMNPNRMYVAANKAYHEESADRAKHANEALGLEAVRLVTENDVGCTLALLRRADILLLNSVIDGMNLTAFEGAMLSERNCALILSENCGAAEVLGSACQLVNPFDASEQLRALSAMLDTTVSDRAPAYQLLREHAAGYTLESWVDNQTASLADRFDGGR